MFYRKDPELVHHLMNLRSPVSKDPRNHINIKVISDWIEDVERTCDNYSLDLVTLGEGEYISHFFND